MKISPKVEPWLRALLDGVENSNNSAEVVATAAYDAEALVKALRDIARQMLSTELDASDYPDPDYESGFDECVKIARAALAIAGETP